MKKLDELMHTLDQKVDKAIGPGYRYVNKYFAIFSAVLLSAIVLLVGFKMYYTKPFFVASIIKNDLTQVEKILHEIDKKCEILGIQSTREPINFLTVKSFVGSMVGGINLAHPKNWTGPYLEQNPSIQKKYYELVQAKDGFFIIPGQGVMLPNGAVIGKDVVISDKAPIAPQLKPGGYLYYKGIPLAVKVSFKIGDWHRQAPQESTIDKLNKTLEEFNEAMPFTENYGQPRRLLA